MKSFGSSPKVLNVVIDESLRESTDETINREALDSLEAELSMRTFLKPSHHKAKNGQRIFKDYLLSPQAFHIENSLN